MNNAERGNLPIFSERYPTEIAIVEMLGEGHGLTPHFEDNIALKKLPCTSGIPLNSGATNGEERSLLASQQLHCAGRDGSPLHAGMYQGSTVEEQCEQLAGWKQHFGCTSCGRAWNDSGFLDQGLLFHV